MKDGIGVVAADFYFLYHLLPTCILLERWRIQAYLLLYFHFVFFSFLMLLANATSLIGYDGLDDKTRLSFEAQYLVLILSLQVTRFKRESIPIDFTEILYVA